MNHLSLFSGIGGFDLAAEWIGWKNIGQVEKDAFCLQVLNKNFPDVPKFTDIKTFTKADLPRGVDIITGGFPCQPFSQAGVRRGRDDDRHLWPEMLRVIQEFNPTWVVAENVRGLLTIEKGLAFEQVCLDLEALNYDVQPIIIPACALNAPHRRDRVWFIGHSNKSELNRKKQGGVRKEGSKEKISGAINNSSRESGRANQLLFADREFNRYESDDTNPVNKGLEGQQQSKTTGQYRQLSGKRSYERPDWDKNWLEIATKFCSVDDGLPLELEQFKLSKSQHQILSF